MKELDIYKTQKIALEMLKVIANICEENNIDYFLAWGTLIGAVRHKGFIPWDDDVDILMPREDYNKFLKIFLNVTNNYDIYSVNNTDRYYISLSRIIDNTTIIIGEKKSNEDQKDCGIFIDIYPLDFVGNNEIEIKKYFKKHMKYEWLMEMAEQKHFRKSKKLGVFSFFKYPIYMYSRFKGYKYFYNKMEILANNNNDKNAKFCCSCYGTGGVLAEKLIYPSEWFKDYEYCNFEDSVFRIPKYYHEILCKVYGDYMKLPPQSERIGHHKYKAYLL